MSEHLVDHKIVSESKWDSQDGHLKGFRTSPEFQTFFEAVYPFYNNIEEMHHYNVIHPMGKEENSSNAA